MKPKPSVEPPQRRTYYKYRDKARRLDRAVASIASIGAALSNTTNGVAPVARAVVRAAAEHFEAGWAVLILNQALFQHWVARRVKDQVVIRADDELPPELHTVTRQALDDQRFVVAAMGGGRPLLAAPMLVSEGVAGALAVTPGGAWALDEREMLVLQTFANHAAVAIANALLYEAAQRQRAELEAKNRELEKAAQWLHAARQNEIVNAERNRIGRDLHDSVAQHLLSIGMNLEWCRAQLAQSTESAVYERICTTKELARSAVGRIRETIFELSTYKSREFDLVAALRELALEFQQTTQLPVRFQVLGAARRLDGVAEDALYHIAQEALFNAYKHAGASHVDLGLRFKPGVAILTVADDGVGIAAGRRRAQPHPGGGFGLRNMLARAQEVGADCTIRRRPRGGTAVRVRVLAESDGKEP